MFFRSVTTVCFPGEYYPFGSDLYGTIEGGNYGTYNAHWRKASPNLKFNKIIFLQNN